MTAPLDFTVFTCTYNRASTLPRTYSSLVDQTFRNFEWIVYDNGSTDNTRELLETWKQEADFPVTILSRPDNSAYQKTYNAAIEIARGELFIDLDSDDACVPHALERMLEIWHGIPEQQRPGFSGVTVLCDDQFGNIVGDRFPSDPLDSDSLEVKFRYKVYGEKWGFHRVDVMRDYPFPDSDYHINPGMIWFSMADKYKTRFTNDRLRIYYVEEPGRDDQMTHHLKRSKANVYGAWLNSKYLIDHHLRWAARAPVAFLRNAVLYSQFSSEMGHGLTRQLADIKPLAGRLLVLAAWPAGSLRARFR